MIDSWSHSWKSAKRQVNWRDLSVFSNHDFRIRHPVAVLMLVGLLGFSAPISCPDESPNEEQAPGLRISDTGHYLLKDGVPFFWLGDTAWSLVNRYTKDEAEEY